MLFPVKQHGHLQGTPMDAITFIAEQRIREALERGDFDGLSGAGVPLNLEADKHVPEELRMAYTLLKNSGYLKEDTDRAMPVDNLRACLPPAEAKAYGCGLRLEVLRNKAKVLSVLDRDDAPTSAYLAKLERKIA